VLRRLLSCVAALAARRPRLPPWLVYVAVIAAHVLSLELSPALFLRRGRVRGRAAGIVFLHQVPGDVSFLRALPLLTAWLVCAYFSGPDSRCVSRGSQCDVRT